ncbi:hypothetical protein SAMN04488689_11145 [Paenibacillus sp. cl6col]|nr:hypothetical protein PAAL66ix_25803 [Paenibacillus alvei A6-6i-x]SDG22815.1 hypothetical protein SAMN04488689_11145 [Paenibacillus sp. cl6col]
MLSNIKKVVSFGFGLLFLLIARLGFRVNGYVMSNVLRIKFVSIKVIKGYRKWVFGLKARWLVSLKTRMAAGGQPRGYVFSIDRVRSLIGDGEGRIM